MPVYKDSNGSWYAMVRYDDWQGKHKQKCKRGFSTKREAQNWERSFLLQSSNDLDMTFSSFYEIYANDVKGRLKQTTWESKEHIIKTKILPYFGDKPISEIKSNKGRFRSRTIGFRVSPEEDAQINVAVSLSGLTKQDYITNRLLCRDIVVLGNPRVYKALKDQLAKVLDELKRIENGAEVDEDLRATIKLITVTLDGMKQES